MRRGAGVRSAAILVAILGIAAIPAVAYSTGAEQHGGSHAVIFSRAKAKEHKMAEKCKKGRVRKNGKCVKKKTSPPSRSTTPTTTTPAPEALSATLIVHVQPCGRVRGTPEDEPELEREEVEAAEAEPLRIERLGPNGNVLSALSTEEHTLHVAPGSYAIQVGAREMERGTQVTVSAGQSLEVRPVDIACE